MHLPRWSRVFFKKLFLKKFGLNFWGPMLIQLYENTTGYDTATPIRLNPTVIFNFSLFQKEKSYVLRWKFLSTQIQIYWIWFICPAFDMKAGTLFGQISFRKSKLFKLLPKEIRICLILMRMFICPPLDRKYTFWANLIQIVYLRWKLIPRLI